jgi:oxaloacetate decarboxylase beta subunit
VGCSTQADVFLTAKSLGIFFLGSVAFSIATASGVIFAKIMNLFLRTKINPMLGAAGVSAVPGSAREVHLMGLREDPTNFLLMHGMACNSSGVIGSAICAGILWSFFIGL